MSAWVRTPLLVVAFFPPFNTLFFKNRAYHSLDSRIRLLAGRGATRTTRGSGCHRPKAHDSASGLGVVRRRRPSFRQAPPQASAAQRRVFAGPKWGGNSGRGRRILQGGSRRAGRTPEMWLRSYRKLPLQESQNNVYRFFFPAKIKYSRNSSANSSKAETISTMV